MSWDAESTRIRTHSCCCRKGRASMDPPGSTYLLVQIMLIFILTLRIFLEQRQKQSPSPVGDGLHARWWQARMDCSRVPSGQSWRKDWRRQRISSMNSRRLS